MPIILTSSNSCNRNVVLSTSTVFIFLKTFNIEVQPIKNPSQTFKIKGFFLPIKSKFS